MRGGSGVGGCARACRVRMRVAARAGILPPAAQGRCESRSPRPSTPLRRRGRPRDCKGAPCHRAHGALCARARSCSAGCAPPPLGQRDVRRRVRHRRCACGQLSSTPVLYNRPPRTSRRGYPLAPQTVSGDPTLPGPRQGRGVVAGARWRRWWDRCAHAGGGGALRTVHAQVVRGAHSVPPRPPAPPPLSSLPTAAPLRGRLEAPTSSVSGACIRACIRRRRGNASTLCRVEVRASTLWFVCVIRGGRVCLLLPPSPSASSHLCRPESVLPGAPHPRLNLLFSCRLRAGPRADPILSASGRGRGFGRGPE